MLGQSFLNVNLDGGFKGRSGISWMTLSGIAQSHQHGPGVEPDGGGATHLPNTSPSPQSSHIWIGLLLSSTYPGLSMTFTKDAGLYEC